MDAKLARNATKVHHRADSSQAEGVPVAKRISAINIWKMMNSTEREMSISQGCETIFAFVIEIELGRAVVCKVILLHH